MTIISSYVTPPATEGAPNMQEISTARGWADQCLSMPDDLAAVVRVLGCGRWQCEMGMKREIQAYFCYGIERKMQDNCEGIRIGYFVFFGAKDGGNMLVWKQ